MHQSAIDAWVPFNSLFEGVVDHMYLDQLGLVTTGMGNLIDSVADAQAVSGWRHADGNLASADEVATEWASVKNGSPATTLHLDPADIQALVDAKRTAFEDEVKQQAEFTQFDNWPADAQLAVMSLAWAQGPDFSSWPNFRQAVANSNWFGAAGEGHLRNDPPFPYTNRNAANRVLFMIADWAAAPPASPVDQLFYDPTLTTDPATITELNLDTRRFPIPLDWPVGVQWALKQLGFSPGPIDDGLGGAGSQTRTALAAYQGVRGLSATGEPDAATRQALITDLDAAGVAHWEH